MRVRIVDAFADRPFTGNPAGVCLLDDDSWPDDSWLRMVAGELNLPMTAFARPLRSDADADWALRWFNAVAEDDLCGHATLATAHALHEDRGAADSVRFSTRSGILTAHSDDDGAITMDFPAPTLTPIPAPDGLAKAFGVEPQAVYWATELHDLLAVLADEATLRAISPDPMAVLQLSKRDGARGIGITAPAAPGTNGDYDFISRFFCPAIGIPEDMVTGSAHTEFAVYWTERLGRTPLTGFQASPRTGVVGTEVRDQRVLLTGRAVTVVDGDLLSDPA
jgi:PhzF family phenazine biosynthesis protein